MFKIAYICVGNSCRSQMAEAVSRQLCNNSDYQFVSAGSSPAKAVASNSLVVLKEIGINWDGKPKNIQTILSNGAIDIIVTMGYEVSCPVIPGVRLIRWEIPDPIGKDIVEYRKVLNMIKEKVSGLLKELGNG